jgi:predicted amidohydrolase
MEEKLVVALVQACLEWEDVPGNLARFDERLEETAGADVIVLPEMFASGFTMEGKERVASYYKEVLAWARERAARLDALIVGSTVHESGGSFFNRLLAVFPDGEVLHYDKRHLFSMGGEERHFTAGKERLSFAYKGVKIAPFVCYDLRFPAWSRNVAGHEYDAAIYVANWPESRREAWRALLVARAIENQAFVIGVNRVGRDGHGTLHAGDSAVISPRGEVVGGVAPGTDAVALVTLELAAAREFRARFPVLRDADRFYIEP